MKHFSGSVPELELQPPQKSSAPTKFSVIFNDAGRVIQHGSVKERRCLFLHIPAVFYTFVCYQNIFMNYFGGC